MGLRPASGQEDFGEGTRLDNILLQYKDGVGTLSSGFFVSTEHSTNVDSGVQFDLDCTCISPAAYALSEAALFAQRLVDLVVVE